jgi:hypothetical protein
MLTIINSRHGRPELLLSEVCQGVRSLILAIRTVPLGLGLGHERDRMRRILEQVVVPRLTTCDDFFYFLADLDHGVAESGEGSDGQCDGGAKYLPVDFGLAFAFRRLDQHTGRDGPRDRGGYHGGQQSPRPITRYSRWKE